MAITKKEEKTIAYRVYSRLCAIFAILLIVIGGVLLAAGNFARQEVRKEISAQKIYFPAKGSPSFDAKTYPDLQKYAGQLIDDGVKARAYANGYIGRHLKEVAGGKTYAEVSALSRADPTNTTLKAQKETLLQGELLRGTLLGNGYGYWMMGTMARYAAAAAFAVAAGLLVLTYVFVLRPRK